MQDILELLKATNEMSPLGIIALLGAVIWMLVRAKNEMTAQVKVIGDNHLHEMPELVANSRRTVDVLQRIEVRLGEDLTYIKGKVEEK